MEQDLAVADIPPGLLLNRYSGDLDVRVEDHVPASRARPAMPSSNVRLADNFINRVEIDSTKFKTTGEIPDRGGRRKGASRSAGNERVALIRAPGEDTNIGRNPQSRSYVRGVLHTHPVALALGAVVTLLFFTLLPVGLISGFLLFLSGEFPARFGWVPQWVLVFPLLLPIVGLLYLVLALPGSCRVCGQKLLTPRACLKNAKAHYVWGLGYIVPLCLHMLYFKWFRCSYCGTPARLKK